MIITLNESEKGVFRKLWRPCVCTVSGWSGVEEGPVLVQSITDGVMVVTAGDPYGLDLSDAENARLDRKFGEDIKAEWWRVQFKETHRTTKGYLFKIMTGKRHLHAIDIIRQAHQLAGFLFFDGERSLLWNDTSSEDFPPP